MSTGSFIITLFEIAGVLGLLWCIFHEDRLVAFEERLFAGFKRKRLHVVETKNTRGFNI